MRRVLHATRFLPHSRVPRPLGVPTAMHFGSRVTQRTARLAPSAAPGGARHSRFLFPVSPHAPATARAHGPRAYPQCTDPPPGATHAELGVGVAHGAKEEYPPTVAAAAAPPPKQGPWLQLFRDTTEIESPDPVPRTTMTDREMELIMLGGAEP